MVSTFTDSIILFILCTILFPKGQWNALHIMFVAVTFSLYCFEISISEPKWQNRIGIANLILCFFYPELSVFLPLFYYIFIYRRQYLLPFLYSMPILLFVYRDYQHDKWLLLLPLCLGLYLAYQNRMKHNLQQTIKALRDDSVEKEILLKHQNKQLLDNQNEHIYIATLQERNRIAREIHDNVGHMLSRSILQVGALMAICTEETVKPHLEALKDTLNEAMNNIRNSVHDLHDESVDLEDALKELVGHFTFCDLHLDYDMTKHIPKDVKYCFLGIIREALNNIMRHSNATEVSVTTKEHPGFYQLLIEDNGTLSENLPESAQRGMGLANMEDRVHALHGIIHFSCEHGFRIFVSIPK